MDKGFIIRNETWCDVRQLRQIMEGKGKFDSIEERESEIDRLKERIADRVITQLMNADKSHQN